MEFDFKKKVVLFVLVVLAIVLFIMAYAINKKTNDIKWPPYVANCPDYWLDLASNGSSCFNQHGLGTCAIPTASHKNTVNFTNKAYTGSEGECNKKKWSENCGVTWDGISYGYGNHDPCSKD
jgi:hypothetical protein